MRRLYSDPLHLRYQLFRCPPHDYPDGLRLGRYCRMGLSFTGKRRLCTTRSQLGPSAYITQAFSLAQAGFWAFHKRAGLLEANRPKNQPSWVCSMCQEILFRQSTQGDRCAPKKADSRRLPLL